MVSEDLQTLIELAAESTRELNGERTSSGLLSGSGSQAEDNDDPDADSDSDVPGL